MLSDNEKASLAAFGANNADMHDPNELLRAIELLQHKYCIIFENNEVSIFDRKTELYVVKSSLFKALVELYNETHNEDGSLK